MNIKTESLYLDSVFLSDVELYYTSPDMVRNDQIIIRGEEVHHIQKVMRHNEGDDIFITEGKGNIFKTTILELSKENLIAEIKSITHYENKLSNVTFCIPRLKNPDRFEFALEKCVELGITNFIIFQAENSVSKGEKLERWNKILLAAMKQSLRSHLPNLTYNPSVEKIIADAETVVFLDQHAQESLSDIILKKEKNYYFIFGPEGGFSSREKQLLNNSESCRLTENRLRAETAIMTSASILSAKM